MPTIIDSLVVRLGLDSSDFRKGSQQASRSTAETQETVRKSADAMGRALKDVTRQVAVLFLGFEGSRGLIDFLAKINATQASLSRTSQNFGLSARSLDVWGKAVRLAGGTAEGAQSAVNQLNQDITALQTQGESSPLLRFLATVGVNFQNIGEHGRTAVDVYKDLFAVLSRMPRDKAFQLAQQFGVSTDLLQLGTRPASEQASLFKEAERLSRANDANTKAADELREKWVEIKLAIEDIGIEVLSKITPAMKGMLPVVEKIALKFADWIKNLDQKTIDGFVDSVTTKMDGLIDRLKDISDLAKTINDTFKTVGGTVDNALHDPDGVIQQTASKLDDIAEDFRKVWGGHLFDDDDKNKAGNAPLARQHIYEGVFKNAESLYGLPPGLLQGVAKQESNFNPNAVSAAGARGLMQLNPSSFPNAGKDPATDIMTAAKELARLFGRYHDWDMALRAYNDGEGNLQAHLANGTLPKETQDYPMAVRHQMDILQRRGIGGGSAAVASVNIDTVVINTKATDGEKTGQAFADYFKNQKFVFQTNTGMVP